MDTAGETPKLTTIDRRKLLQRGIGSVLTLAVGGTIAGCGGTTEPGTDSPTSPKPTETPLPTLDNDALRSYIDSFSWDEASNPEKRNQFAETMADAYLGFTNTQRVNKSDLLENGSLTFATDRNTFIEKIREVEPEYDPSATQWGYTNYASGKVFIDMESLQKQAETQGGSAGMALIDALWHEWGHLDVTERTEGSLLNNPAIVFHSEVSGRDEELRRYRGGAAYTDTYYGMTRFEEVLNETITVRRMIEEAGLPAIISGADYYSLGVDFFPKLTEITGIPLDELYERHATSDFEGLATRIGQSLPAEGDPLAKGVNLFVGIHTMDEEMIRQTGAFDLIAS